jgi:hypothetical protein
MPSSKFLRPLALAACVGLMLSAGGAVANGATAWTASLTSVTTGSMGCRSSDGTAAGVSLRQQWDYWDSCGGTVVDPASDRIPNPPSGGARAVRWQKPTSSDQVYQKLNRTFTKTNWPSGGTSQTGSPADVSARYVTYRYFPSSQLVLNPSHGWMVMMSFKENYVDSGGRFHQDGTGWKVGCNNFTPGYRGIVRCSMTPKKSFAMASYTDRWVKWEYRLYQGSKDTTGHHGRIELWADDKLIDTGYEGENGDHIGSAAFVPLSQTRAWVWTVGQYTSNQTTNGVPDWKGTHMTSYVGPTSVTPV